MTYPTEDYHFLVSSGPPLETIEDLISRFAAYRLLDHTQTNPVDLALDLAFLARDEVGSVLGMLPQHRYHLHDHTKADAPNKAIWAWDAKLKQYRHLASGKIIGAKRMLELRDIYTDRQALRAEQLVEQLVRGEISLQDWLLAQRQLIKETYIAQYAMARGGRSQMTPQDYGRLGADLKKQYAYLQAFGQDIQSGKYRSAEPANLIARIANRIKLYIESATQAFEKGKIAVFGGNLYDHITNFPGAGKTRCLTRCRCHLDVTENETEWLVRWVLDPAAEHCEDCVSLSEQWNPLRVGKPKAVKAVVIAGQGTDHETTHDASTGQFAPKNGGSKPATPPAAPQPDLDYEHLQQNVQVATERERLDMQEGFAQQRIDLETNRQAQLEEMQISHQNYLEDQKNGFDETVRETALRQAQQRADVERKLAQQRADRLTRYQRQVRDVKKAAARDAEDLTSSRDAVGFLKRGKARDTALSTAGQQLNDDLTDFDTQAGRNRKKLDTAEAREIAALGRQQQQMQQAARELKRAMNAADRQYNRQRTQQQQGEQRAEKAFTTWAKRLQEDAETSYKEHLKKKEKETKKDGE